MATEKELEATPEAKELKLGTGFLGQPKAIGTLSTMQLFNSLSNYTMSAILVYYLYATVAEGGLGFSKTDAAQLISLYSAVMLLAGLVGSVVADRILGPRTGLRLQRCINTLGYVLLAIPGTGVFGYAGSQVLLVIAAMMGGRSVEALTGKMYEQGDARRDTAFTINYTIANIGAAVPAIAGAIALATGYHGAFAVAAVSSVLGLVCYLLTEKRFFGPIGTVADDPMPTPQRNRFVAVLATCVIVFVAALAYLFLNAIITIKQFANTMSTAAIFIPLVYLAYIIKSSKTRPEEAKKVIALLPLYACNALAMLVWTQSTSVLAIYAETSVNLNLFGVEISPATFQTVPGILGLVFGALATGVWAKMGQKQPSNPTKIGLGTILWGLGPVFMCLPFLLFPAGVKVSPLWLVFFYVIIIAGEAITTGPGYASATIVAPAAFVTQMVTVWSLSQSTGAGLSTLVSQFYVEGSEISYFLAIGGATIVVGVLVLIGSKKLTHLMGLDAAEKAFEQEEAEAGK